MADNTIVLNPDAIPNGHGDSIRTIDQSGVKTQVVASGGQAPDGTINIAGNGLAFSTSATLANGATYDSGVLNLSGHTQVQTHVLSNKNGTVTVDFCRDASGSDILRTLTIPYTGGSGFQMFSAPAFSPYVRYRFTCGETGQTDFYFDTKFLNTSLSPQLLRLDAFISPAMSASLGRNILVGKTTGGDSYQNIGIDGQANLQVALKEPRTAFGELMVAESTPTVQVDFVYGLNTFTTKTALTGSGQVTSSGGMVSAATTAATASSAVAYSSRLLKYRPGQGALVRFTALFTDGAEGSVQYAGTGFTDLSNGVFFGYEGETFGIALIKSGSSEFVAQSAWNVDVMNGAGGSANPSGQNLNPANGNVYQIKYQYLGFGSLFFYIEDSATGNLVLVHTIRYANLFDEPSLLNPSMPILWAAKNTTNNTNIIVKGASCYGAVEGKRALLGPRSGDSTTKTGVTTQTAAFTLKNATTYNGIANGSSARIRTITFGSNTGGVGNGITYLRLVKNTTLSGVLNFVPVSGSTADNGVTITSGNSNISVDKGGTTLSGGTVEYNSIIAIGNSMSENATDLEIFLGPGETLTLAVESTTSATVGVGVTWTEDL